VADVGKQESEQFRVAQGLGFDVGKRSSAALIVQTR
jgi:hypothetical protein